MKKILVRTSNIFVNKEYATRITRNTMEQESDFSQFILFFAAREPTIMKVNKKWISTTNTYPDASGMWNKKKSEKNFEIETERNQRLQRKGIEILKTTNNSEQKIVEASNLMTNPPPSP